MSEPFPKMPKTGDRIEYLFSKVLMDDLQPGDQGEVLSADAFGTIRVAWDDGRTFTLARAWDYFNILPPKEEEKEENTHE